MQKLFRTSRAWRINQPAYAWYVVDSAGKIVAGNEYRGDAVDASRDQPWAAGPYKVVSFRTLQRSGRDPNDNRNWR